MLFVNHSSALIPFRKFKNSIVESSLFLNCIGSQAEGGSFYWKEFVMLKWQRTLLIEEECLPNYS